MANRDESDEELIAAWSGGDRSAGEELLARLARPVSAIARAICGATAIAEEAAQDAGLRIVRARGSFRTGARVRPWAYAIARNAAWDLLRRRRPDVALEEIPESAGGESPTDALLRREDAERIALAIDGLPATLRETFVLRYALEVEVPEIARILDVAQQAVWTRLSRARSLLRRRLGDER